jgi:hypothetical protein
MIPTDAIHEAMCLLPAEMRSLEAEVMLIAIGLQESRFKYRRQLVGSPPKPIGPAAGFWQFEKGSAASRGGVWGVFLHESTNHHVKTLCAARGIPASPSNIWETIQTDDVLAAGIARLLLWTDPKRLPAIGKESEAWALYLRTWRPGKPHPETWPALYADAVRAV